jgi:hypothetical protein
VFRALTCKCQLIKRYARLLIAYSETPGTQSSARLPRFLFQLTVNRDSINCFADCDGMTPKQASKYRQVNHIIRNVIWTVRKYAPFTSFALFAPTSKSHSLHPAPSFVAYGIRWRRCVDVSAALQVHHLSRKLSSEFYLCLVESSIGFPEVAVRDCVRRNGCLILENVGNWASTVDMSVDRYLIVNCNLMY